MRVLSVAVFFVSLLGGCSCGGAHDLAVDVRTDLVPGTEFDTVQVELDAAPAAPVAAHAGDDYATGRRVVELSGVPPGLRRIDVTLVRGGAAVVSRRVHVMLDDHRIVLVVLTRDCREVECPRAGDDANQTECFGGRCVAPECSEEHPEACGTSECAADGDCTTTTGCIEPRCAGGVCLELPRAGACAAGEACLPGTGCIAVSPDAGGETRDAGSVADGGGTPDGGGTSDGGGPTGACHGVPAGTPCRAAAGPCDAAEACDGTRDECPADAFVPAGTGCDAGSCDGLGTCLSGCTPGAPCSTGNPCELGAIACAGTTPSCAGAGPAPASTVCRAAAGECDVEERCTGSSTECPPDGFASGSARCRDPAGPCDAAESCTGSSPVCPANGLLAPGTVCQAEGGGCEANDVCTGSSPDCPEAYAPAGTPCRGGAGPCNPADVCTGASGTCPPDAPAADGTPCNQSCGFEMCMGGACTGGRVCGASQRCGCDEFCVCSTCACL